MNLRNANLSVQFSQENFCFISTSLPQNSSSVRRRFAESRAGAIIKRLFSSRHTELAGGVVGALLVLGFWGTNVEGQGLIFRSRVQNYIVDTAIVRDGIRQVVNPQAADIGSIFSGASGGGSEQTPMPTIGATAIQGSTVVALAPPDTDYLDGFKADQVVKYTVQSGDTIGGIASNFGVSVDTVIWANNLRNPNVLSLGQILKIPPVTGVIHTVQTGDTVASIAKKYKSSPEVIVSFNKLQDGQVLIVGNELMVPGGELSGPKPSAQGSGGYGIYVPVGNGQCVDFVQAHGFSNMSGNASTWKRYINTPTPVAGGVVVLRGGRYGHVALVTAVKLDSVQIVEQNYYSPFIVDHREISLNDRSIVGFIQ